MRAVRSRAITVKRLTREVLRAGAVGLAYELQILDSQRPVTRADCLPGGCNEERPCPFVACKQHLYLDVNPYTGSITLNFPDLAPEDLVHSCALDDADRGGMTLEEVGERLNVTRERTRQIEIGAFHQLRDDALSMLGEVES